MTVAAASTASSCACCSAKDKLVGKASCSPKSIRGRFRLQLTQAEGQMARDQALLANARIDLERYRTLLAQDSIAKQLVDTQEALVRQYEGHGQAPTREQSRTHACSSRIRGSLRRLAAVSACARSTPAISCAPAITNGLVVITQLQPITVIFTIPQDNVQVVLKRMQSGERVPVEAFDRDQKAKLAHRRAAHRRQSDRSHYRHRQAESAVSER